MSAEPRNEMYACRVGSGTVPTNKSEIRELRVLVEELIGGLVEEGHIYEANRDDLVTSLVRQWITYRGNATLFLREQQFYLTLSRTPLGKPCPRLERVSSDWVEPLTEDWKIDPDDLADVFDQLNRGQSAEVTNTDGIPLRLSVDPSQRARHVEPLVKEQRPEGFQRDYHKIATRCLEQQFGESLEFEELEALVCSVVGQWKRFQGVACLFHGPHQIFLKCKELEDGGCQTDAWRERSDIERQLAAFNCPPNLVPEVIVRMNLCQPFGLRDRHGTTTRLWYDPRIKRLVAGPDSSTLKSPGPVSPPIFCPRCRAVLSPWQASQRQQTCQACGLVTTLVVQE